MEKKNNFWRDVYQESRRRVRGQFGVKGEALKLALTIIFTTIAIGILSVFGIMQYFGIDYSIPEIVWFLFGSAIIVVIVLLISEPIIAFFQMFSVAAEMNLRILQIQEKLVANAVSKDASHLVTQEINQKDWVGIRVINQEDKFIEGLIKIESIPESPNFSDSLELKRHGISGVDLFKLSKDSHNDFDVAIIRGHSGKAAIPHHGGIYFFEIDPGEYYLETHLIGTFKDPPYGLIKPRIEYWRLVYNQNTNPILQLTKVSDVLSKIKIRAKDKKTKGGRQ